MRKTYRLSMTVKSDGCLQLQQSNIVLISDVIVFLMNYFLNHIKLLNSFARLSTETFVCINRPSNNYQRYGSEPVRGNQASMSLIALMVLFFCFITLVVRMGGCSHTVQWPEGALGPLDTVATSPILTTNINFNNSTL